MLLHWRYPVYMYIKTTVDATVDSRYDTPSKPEPIGFDLPHVNACRVIVHACLWQSVGHFLSVDVLSG